MTYSTDSVTIEAFDILFALGKVERGCVVLDDSSSLLFKVIPMPQVQVYPFKQSIS